MTGPDRRRSPGADPPAEARRSRAATWIVLVRAGQGSCGRVRVSGSDAEAAERELGCACTGGGHRVAARRLSRERREPQVG